MSHDAINRYLRQDRVTGADVWHNVRGDMVHSPNGYVVFDDTVLDKNFSHRIELVRRQYSGNAHGLIKGIGVVNCVYVNPDIEGTCSRGVGAIIPTDFLRLASRNTN
jgi:hypothetical protein